MVDQKYRRKRYFILVRFQLKYILYILLFLYVGALIAGYTVYYSTWVTLGEKLANVYPQSRLIYIFKAANWALFWRLILITPLFILIGTFLSHRIAGPIYRISRYIDSLMLGDYSKGLTLRKHDELKGLAAKMTQLCDSLKEGQQKRSSAVDDALQSLKKQGVSDKVVEEIKTKLEKAKV